MYSTNKLELLFSKEPYLSLSKTEPFYLNSISPSLKGVGVLSNEFFENDSVWTEIKLTYKAKGGEKYFTIGVFYDEKIFSCIKKWERLKANGGDIKKFESKKAFFLSRNVSTEENNIEKFAYYFFDKFSLEKKASFTNIIR